jgi:hypothetical protein
MNCPLKLEVGCQYGKNLECEKDYEECCFYQLNERSRLFNLMALIQLKGLEVVVEDV